MLKSDPFSLEPNKVIEGQRTATSSKEQVLTAMFGGARARGPVSF